MKFVLQPWQLMLIILGSWVNRARVTQILNLLLLAPDIQTQILQLPSVGAGGLLTTERDLRTVLQSPDWRKQRRLWSKIGG